MGQLHPYSTIWEKNRVAILHIYGARAILLLFCDLQDTEFELYEIEISISQPIFIHKKISKDLWDNDIHALQYGRKIVIIIHIYGALAIFLLFCNHQDTESE